jgi:hypothetical protein
VVYSFQDEVSSLCYSILFNRLLLIVLVVECREEHIGVQVDGDDAGTLVSCQRWCRGLHLRQVQPEGKKHNHTATSTISQS